MIIRMGTIKKVVGDDGRHQLRFAPTIPLLCDGCGSDDLFSASPGMAGRWVQIGARWVPTALARPDIGWCAGCWPFKSA